MGDANKRSDDLESAFKAADLARKANADVVGMPEAIPGDDEHPLGCGDLAKGPAIIATTLIWTFPRSERPGRPKYKLPIRLRNPVELDEQASAAG